MPGDGVVDLGVQLLGARGGEVGEVVELPAGDLGEAVEGSQVGERRRAREDVHARLRARHLEGELLVVVLRALAAAHEQGALLPLQHGAARGEDGLLARLGRHGALGVDSALADGGVVGEERHNLAPRPLHDLRGA